MDSFEIFCDVCNKTTEYCIVEVKDGEDCWKVFVVKCKECGKEKELNFYC